MDDGGALDLHAANKYLGLAEKSTWLLEPGCPVAHCDLRRPGAGRPLWRWRRATLEEFLRRREIRPGEPNPQEFG